MRTRCLRSPHRDANAGESPEVNGGVIELVHLNSLLWEFIALQVSVLRLYTEVSSGGSIHRHFLQRFVGLQAATFLEVTGDEAEVLVHDIHLLYTV